ncbi:DHH phosphoesterase [Wallemia mellicola]|nr:DHH phosphoesterase [Wallemia mellicola]
MNRVLAATRSRFIADLNANSIKNWTIVLGNQASDSLASSIAFSYLSTLKDSPVVLKNTVPVIQSTREDLNLRPENKLALSNAKIDPSQLTFYSDISQNIDPATNYALVDHFALDNQWKSPESDIVAVIDHHDGAPERHPSALLWDIRTPVGSCASLVTDNFKKVWSQSEIEIDIERSIADLLIQAIIIDTNNLKEGGKAQPVDYEAYDFLLPRSSFGDGATSMTVSTASNTLTAGVFNNLSDSKNDVSALNTTQLLKRDYKRVYTNDGLSVGFASVPLSLDTWIEENAGDMAIFEKEIQKFTSDDGKDEGPLDLLGIGTSYHDKNSKSGHKHRRELLLHVPMSSKLAGVFGKLREGIESNEILKLKVKDLHLDLADSVAYTQKNSDATRKQYMPAILSMGSQHMASSILEAHKERKAKKVSSLYTLHALVQQGHRAIRKGSRESDDWKTFLSAIESILGDFFDESIKRLDRELKVGLFDETSLNVNPKLKEKSLKILKMWSQMGIFNKPLLEILMEKINNNKNILEQGAFINLLITLDKSVLTL